MLTRNPNVPGSPWVPDAPPPSRRGQSGSKTPTPGGKKWVRRIKRIILVAVGLYALWYAAPIIWNTVTRYWG